MEGVWGFDVRVSPRNFSLRGKLIGGGDMHGTQFECNWTVGGGGELIGLVGGGKLSSLVGGGS